ncbi:ATP-binding cassette domain-containing protein [Candidatus Spongiihabitans sp.]|uniref:ATP-binding cassette domain-containing protein n=1 Tax=Candidatus Spongiihabitans sp. TaxID=3101308 RepID=UPI003C7AF108
MPKICSVNNLSFSYPGKTVLENANMTFESGKTYGLLGPNGSGKTTFLELLFNRLDPQAGNVKWRVANIDRFYLKQNITVPNAVTMGKFIEMIFRVNQGKYSEERFMEYLPNAWEEKYKSIRNKRPFNASIGENRFVSVISSLHLDSQFLALDEPTVAMDVSTRNCFWKEIEKRKTLGRSTLITSHYLEEMDGNIDYLVTLKNRELNYLENLGLFKEKYSFGSNNINNAFSNYFL